MKGIKGATATLIKEWMDETPNNTRVVSDICGFIEEFSVAHL